MSEEITQSFAKEVLRLGNEVRDLAEENKELHKDYESLADEHTKLIERNKTLKAEVDALKLGSLLTAVDVLQFINLKSEVEAHEKRWAESEDLISHYKQQRDEAINDCQCSRLKAEVEAYKTASDEVAAAFLALPKQHSQVARVCEGIECLKAEVERLRKAVMHSPAAQLKLKELEGKTTYEEINAAKEGKPSV